MLNGVLRSQNQKIFGASRHILVFQSLDHQNFKKWKSCSCYVICKMVIIKREAHSFNFFLKVSYYKSHDYGI